MNSWKLVVALAVLRVAPGCSKTDDSAEVPADCRSIEGRHYDAEKKCLEDVVLSGVCFSAKGERTSEGENVCVRDPDGAYYFQVQKDFNECLSGPGWTTDGSGSGHGWMVWGSTSPCASDFATVLPDGGVHYQSCGPVFDGDVPDCE